MSGFCYLHCIFEIIQVAFINSSFFCCCVVFLFTHVPVYRHLGCFQCLATMNKTAVNIHVLDEYMHSFLSCVYQRVESLGHRVSICLSLVDTASFPEWLYQFTLLAAMIKSYLHPCQLLELSVFLILNILVDVQWYLLNFNWHFSDE